jgi:hypothetical protein
MLNIVTDRAKVDASPNKPIFSSKANMCAPVCVRLAQKRSVNASRKTQNNNAGINAIHA